MKRNPLDKARVGVGVRQFWAGVLLLCGAGVLFVSIHYPHVEVGPFLNYGALIGSTFILGLSVDSAIKTKAAARTRRDPADYQDEI